MKTLKRILRGAAVALVVAVAIGVAVAWTPDRPLSSLTPRWAPPPSRFVEADGMNVHVRDEGPRTDPVPIVMLHGTSASLHTWEGWARELAPKRRVVRFDLPGFGLTGPAADGDYSLESYVRFMRTMLDRLEIRRCVVVGNSFGGTVAIVTALAMPDRVEKLVLVDSGGYPLDPASMPIGFRIASTPVLNRVALNLMTRGIIESSVRHAYGDPSKVTPELIDRYYEITLREGNRRALGECFRQVPAEGIGEKIPKLKLPTLVLWGGRDRLIPPSQAEQFHRDIAGSTVVVFEDLGHVPQEEDPLRTVVPVKAFLGVE